MFLFLSHGIKIIQTIEEISLHLLVGSISIWYTFEIYIIQHLYILTLKKGGTFFYHSTNFHQAIWVSQAHLVLEVWCRKPWSLNARTTHWRWWWRHFHIWKMYGSVLFGPLVLGLLCFFKFSGPELFLLHLRRVVVFGNFSSNLNRIRG